jgi:hypothetical protein
MPISTESAIPAAHHQRADDGIAQPRLTGRRLIQQEDRAEMPPTIDQQRAQNQHQRQQGQSGGQ